MARFNLAFLLFCFFLPSYGQTNQVGRYVVYFKDKSQSPYRISQPSEFLSDRAIARRAKLNIPITEEDFPVNPWYIDSLRNDGFFVYFTSKWLNAAIIQDTELKVDQLINKSYVDTIIFAARNASLTAAIEPYQPQNSFSPIPSSNHSSEEQNQMIGVDIMHEQGYHGEEMLIAVLDGGFVGVDRSAGFQHLFQENLIIDYYDFVSNGRNIFKYDDHGTCVLSTLAAVDEGRYYGVAYKAKYALFVTEEVGSEFVIEEYNLLLAVERADSLGADVINTSVGYNYFDDPTMDYVYEQLDGKAAIASQAATIAGTKGIVFVSSAGNEGNREWKYVTIPADAENVLAIGAVNSSRSLARFSSIGPTPDGRIKPELVAMGSPTVVLGRNGNFYNGFGTSYSAPQVAGLAAGVWQARPEWTHLQVISALKNSGSLTNTPNNQMGYGVPNFERAISGAVLSVKDILSDKISVYPNPFHNNTIYINLDKSLKNSALRLSLYDQKGREIKEWEIHRINMEILQIDTGDLDSGQYFLNFDFKKNRKTIKLIKF